MFFGTVGLYKLGFTEADEGLPLGGGGLVPLNCSLPKLPYVPMFPHSLRMFSYCNFSNFVLLFPKIG